MSKAKSQPRRFWSGDMTDKELLDTFDNLLDELSARSILEDNQFKEVEKAYVYLEKVLNEK